MLTNFRGFLFAFAVQVTTFILMPWPMYVFMGCCVGAIFFFKSLLNAKSFQKVLPEVSELKFAWGPFIFASVILFVLDIFIWPSSIIDDIWGYRGTKK